MTRKPVEDLKIRHDIGLGWSFELMAWLDMVHLVLIPGNEPSTPPTPTAVSGVHHLP
jgi:hypothetical protein